MQRATDAPLTPTPQVRKIYSTLPLARSKACLQPTNRRSRVAFHLFLILSSLLNYQKATPVHEHPRTVEFQKLGYRLSEKRTTLSKADKRHGASFFTLEQPVSTPEADGLHARRSQSPLF